VAAINDKLYYSDVIFHAFDSSGFRFLAFRPQFISTLINVDSSSLCIDPHKRSTSNSSSGLSIPRSFTHEVVNFALGPAMFRGLWFHSASGLESDQETVHTCTRIFNKALVYDSLYITIISLQDCGRKIRKKISKLVCM
jgi:hypothetical protein